MDIRSRRPLAVVTGGSSGIGRELARQCIAHGFDVVLIASSERVHEVARQLGADVAKVYSHQHDLSTFEGVEAEWKEIEALGRPVDALMLDGGVELAKKVMPGMVGGRVLVTSAAALPPAGSGVSVTELRQYGDDDAALVAKQAFSGMMRRKHKVEGGSLRSRIRRWWAQLFPQPA